MKLKELNNIQVEQLMNLISYYKTFFICNECGTVYGCDMNNQKNVECPNCESETKGNRK